MPGTRLTAQLSVHVQVADTCGTYVERGERGGGVKEGPTRTVVVQDAAC